jgi:hypothetical protein
MKVAHRKVAFIGIGAGLAPALLYSYIRSHPKVCVPKVSTEFFSNIKVFAAGLAWYESQFKDCPPGTVNGELAYEYLQSAPAAGLIARTLPQTQLLAVVENPLLAVRVAYVEARKNNLISSKVSLAQFLKDNREVLQSVRQGRQLSQFFQYYSPTDLLVFTADDVRNEPLKTVATTFEHIGVDPKFIPPTLKYLIEDSESDDKKKPGLIKRGLRAIKKLITWPYRTIITKTKKPAISIEIAFEVARKIPLSPELEQFLRDYYREDVAILSRLMHRSISYEWGFEGE